MLPTFLPARLLAARFGAYGIIMRWGMANDFGEKELAWQVVKRKFSSC